MRACLAELRKSQATITEEKKKVQDSARASTAAIVTYANDEARLTKFISTLLMIQGRRLSGEELAQIENTLQGSTFAETETRLSSAGVERRTRSAFGQFSTFITLLRPDQPVARLRPDQSDLARPE